MSETTDDMLDAVCENCHQLMVDCACTEEDFIEEDPQEEKIS